MELFKVHKSFDDNYVNHQMLKEIFPGEGKVFFYKDGSTLTVVSNIKKQVDSLHIESFGCIENHIKDEGLFKIRMNPVRRKGRQRIKLDQPDKIKDYIDRRLSDIGCDINFMSYTYEGVLRSEKKDMVMYHNSANVFGHYKINNKDKLIQTISKGIGESRAFGFGFFNIFL